MNKEDLILKWLDHNITYEELVILSKYPDFEDFKKISEKAELFKAPSFDQNKVFENIKATRSKKTSSKFWMYGIAASLVLIFGVLFFNKPAKINTYSTDIAQKTEVSLPDGSIVHLNAGSVISFDDKNWKENRVVNLEGEAYFKVVKGKKFDVISKKGIVSVLGTEFVVKDRGDFYHIKTFDGLVQAQTPDTLVKVSKGQIVRFRNSELKRDPLLISSQDWVQGISTFKSIELKEVLRELQLQYDINLEKFNLPEDKLFTGSFPHNNLDEALQSIAIPLNLTYSITSEKTVSLDYIED